MSCHCNNLHVTRSRVPRCASDKGTIEKPVAGNMFLRELGRVGRGHLDIINMICVYVNLLTTEQNPLKFIARKIIFVKFQTPACMSALK